MQLDDFTSLVLPPSLKTMRPKWLWQTFKCLNYLEHQSAQCHITRSTISGPM